MQERELRQLIEEVREGKLPRRGFIQRMVGLGLTAPMASMLLMHEGIAQTQASIPYKPTKRGGGGPLPHRLGRFVRRGGDGAWHGGTRGNQIILETGPSAVCCQLLTIFGCFP